MPEDVEIDWSGFDPVEVPEAPPADVLAAQLDAEAIDQMAAAPALYDVKAFRITEPNTYECRDELRAMGCHWMAAPVKAWIARDQQMREQAINFCRIARGLKAPYPKAGLAPVHNAQAVRAILEDPEEEPAAHPAPHARSRHMRKGIPNGAGGPESASMQATTVSASDEVLVAEAQRRGFTIAKLGQLEPLAQLLGEQDDEEDPFGKILELLK